MVTNWNFKDAISFYKFGDQGVAQDFHNTSILNRPMCIQQLPSLPVPLLSTTGEIPMKKLDLISTSITPTTLPNVVLSSFPVATHDCYKRGRRRTRAQIIVDNVNATTTPTPTEFVQRHRRRTRCEIAADAANGITIPTSLPLTTCRRKRKFMEIVPQPVIVGSAVCPYAASIGRQNIRSQSQVDNITHIRDVPRES